MRQAVVGAMRCLAAALLFAAALFPAAPLPAAAQGASFAPQGPDSVKLTVPSDPCGAAWGKLPARYKKPIGIGGASLDPKTLFDKKCNEYKDRLTAAIRQPLDDAVAGAKGAAQGAYDSARTELRNSFLNWAAEIAREQILPTLPEDQRANFDPNSPFAREKAQEWLADPGREIGAYVGAYIGEHAPNVGRAVSAYQDIVSGQSKEILDGLHGILAKTRDRLSKMGQVETDLARDAKTPAADILEKHGFSGKYIDKFKSYEGPIRALDSSYRIKDTVTIIVGSFQTDEPRAKIDALFELMDVVSGVASDSNIPLVALFGDIVNSYAQVAKEMLAKIDGLAEAIKKRGGYCLGTGAGGGDPRSAVLDARGITACPLAFDTSPWKDIFEQIDPATGQLFFWAGGNFIDGAAGGGGKAGVQETVKLMSAAGGLGYNVETGDLEAIARVYNTPFAGGIPGLMAEARKVMGEIAAAARKIDGALGTAASCPRDAILAQVEAATGIDLKAFLDEVQTDGEARLVTTYAASYVARNGGFGEAGGKRAGAYDRYREIWQKIRDIHISEISGEVRDIKAPSAVCAKCAGAILSVKISGGDEVRSCEAWKADDTGNFSVHAVGTHGAMSAALSAEVKDARSDTLNLSLREGGNSARLLIPFKDEDEKDEDKPDEDDPAACARAQGQIAAANTYVEAGNYSAAETMLGAAEESGCKAVAEDIAGIRGAIDGAVDGARAEAAGALQSCRAAEVDEAAAKLRELGTEALAGDIDKLARAAAAITAADEAIPTAEQVRGSGDFAAARRKLDDARAGLTAAGLACAAIEARIGEAHAAIDRLERLVADADRALGQCAPEPMQNAAAGLGAFTDSIAGEKAQKLTRTAALIARADAAYEAAKAPYKAGDADGARAKLNEAKAALDQLGAAPPCPERRQKIEAALAKVETLAAALSAPESALASCSPAALKAAHASLAKTDHPKLSAMREHIQMVRGLIGDYKTADRDFSRGRLDEAESGLNAIKVKLDGAGANICPDLRSRIAAGLTKIATLRRKRELIEAAIARCSIDTMRGAAEELSGKAHPYLRSLPGKIKKALPGCIRDLAEKTCKRRLGTAARAVNIKSEDDFQCGCTKGHELNPAKTQCVREKTRDEIRAEGSAACHRDLGQNSHMTRRNNNGSYECACDRGYEFNAGKTHCDRKKTRAEIMAEGTRQCRASFGPEAYAVKPGKNGTFECQCRKGHIWNPARTACMRKPTAADGHGQCKQEFGPQAYSVRANNNGSFQCQCQRGWRMDAGAKRCVRQPTAAEGHAQCQKEFGSAARASKINANGTFQCICVGGYEMNAAARRCVQVSVASGHAACKRQFGPTSYATRYNGNGSWQCFTPPVVRLPPPTFRPPARPPGGESGHSHSGGSQSCGFPKQCGGVLKTRCSPAQWLAWNAFLACKKRRGW